MSNVLSKFRKQGKKKHSGGGGYTPPPSQKRKVEARSWEQEGAWRQDEYNNYYWLNADQLAELRQINAECSQDVHGDKEFWRKFAALRKREGITGRRNDAAWGEWDDHGYGGKYTWEDPLKKKGSLSQWWTGYKSSTWVSSDKSAKIALAMQAVEDTVRVIDDSGVRTSVVPHTSTEHSISFTDLKKNKITVSAKPIMEGKLEEGLAMDVMTGFGLHEASHSKKEGTRKYMPEVEKNQTKKELQPVAVTGWIFNVVEDNRIERHTKDDFPGFSGYFDACLQYVWKEAKPPKQYGPDLTSKLNAVVAFLRWPEESAKVLTHKSFEPERKWWTEWESRYPAALDAGKLIPHLVEAVAHLRNATEEEEKKKKSKDDDRAESGKAGQASAEMDKQAEQEEELRKLGQALDEIMREFRARMKEFLTDPCSHQDADEGDMVDEREAQSIQQLRDEELRKEATPIRTADGRGNPDLYITRPAETSHSRAMYDGKADPMLNKYKSALLFRDDKPVDSIKLSREGTVDDDELWRWAADDWRVFQEKEERRLVNARVYLLVDMSGSMSGYSEDSKIAAAQRMARLFVDSLTSMDGVTPKVFGHTGDLHSSGYGGSGTSHIYRLWEPGDKMTRLGLIQALPHGNNYDGHALAWVAKEMMAETQGDEQKIIIIISDGIPAGTDYGAEQGMAHVRQVVADASRKGIRVLQMAIDPEMDEDRQKAMYDEYIPYDPGTSMDAVPRKLTTWLAKQL